MERRVMAVKVTLAASARCRQDPMAVRMAKVAARRATAPRVAVAQAVQGLRAELDRVNLKRQPPLIL